MIKIPFVTWNTAGPQLSLPLWVCRQRKMVAKWIWTMKVLMFSFRWNCFSRVVYFYYMVILEAAVCGAFGLYWVTLNIIILEEVVMVSWSLGNHRVSCHTNINRHILQYTGLMRLVLASSQLTSVQLIRDHYETINIHGEKQSSGQFAWKGHIHMVAILSWHHAQGGN